MNKQRAQYKATPELQNVLNQISPNIIQALNIPPQQLKLRCFSRPENDENGFTFFVDSKENQTFLVDISQKVVNNQAKIQVKRIAKILSNQLSISQ